MKNLEITSFLLALCFVLPNISMNISNDFMPEENLNGWVKSTTIKKYKIYLQSGEIKKNEMIEKIISKYSTNGNITEEQHYKSDGGLGNKTTFFYNENGVGLFENHFRSDGSLNFKQSYIYDNKGNKIERDNYDSKEKFNAKTTFVFDANGNEVEENSYMSISVGGTLGYKKISKYTDNGNLIQADLFGATGDLIENHTWSYEKYDENKNWIKRIEYNNGEPSAIYEREIEFY